MDVARGFDETQSVRRGTTYDRRNSIMVNQTCEILIAIIFIFTVWFFHLPLFIIIIFFPFEAMSNASM